MCFIPHKAGEGRVVVLQGHVFKSFLYVFCALSAGMSVAFAQQPVGVVTKEVELKPFVERIEALGTLQANESVDLTVNVTETITAIHFDDNERVQTGKVLAEMTNAEERAQLEEASSTLDEATKQYERVRKLSKQGNASRALRDERKREMQTADARLTGIQSRMIDRLVIAPFDGVLGFRQVSVGSFVQPGAVVARLVDDSEMNLEFAVPSVFLRLMGPGTEVTASTDDLPGQTFTGTIASVDNAIDPVTRTVMVRAKLPNPERALVSGMFMNVTALADARRVPAVLEEAVQPVGPKKFVFIIELRDGVEVSVRKEVELGVYQDGYVEVKSGVDAGTRIVTDGIIGVRDGGPVKIQSPDILSPDTGARIGAASPRTTDLLVRD